MDKSDPQDDALSGWFSRPLGNRFAIRGTVGRIRSLGRKLGNQGAVENADRATDQLCRDMGRARRSVIDLRDPKPLGQEPASASPTSPAHQPAEA